LLAAIAHGFPRVRKTSEIWILEDKLKRLSAPGSLDAEQLELKRLRLKFGFQDLEQARTCWKNLTDSYDELRRGSKTEKIPQFPWKLPNKSGE
jgi:hypothetical protein